MVKILSFLLTGAFAQGPGNGLSKYTLAAETDPLGGLAFMDKYLHTMPAYRSCTAAVCQCKAGDSGSPTDWIMELGRAQILKSNATADRCIIITKSSGTKSSSSKFEAIIPAADRLSCSTTSDAEVVAVEGDVGYTAYGHTTQCCQACAVDPDCVGATHIIDNPEDELSLPADWEGFGLHLPALHAHKTTGGINVSTVEGYVSQKMGDLTSFDSWMDFSVGLFTSDLDHYLNLWEADKVPYYAAKSAQGVYSVFLHVPKSQMVVELMATKSEKLAGKKLPSIEQRMSDDMYKEVTSNPPEYLLFTAVKVSRAATDLDALDDFYLNGLKLTTTQSVSNSIRCYRWTGAKADVCYYKKDDAMTKGDYKVKDHEKMLKASNDAMTKGYPYCEEFRWEDNHYAVDLRSDFGYFTSYIEANDVRYQCGGPTGQMHYIYDPTGQGIQMDVRFSTLPSDCSELANDDSNPWCDGGTCASSTLFA